MSVRAGHYDMVATQGKTFTLNSTCFNEDGTAFNLTGYTGRMQVRPSSTSDDVLVELTTANERFTFPSPTTSGQVRLQITAADMATLPAGHYVYDSELVNGVLVEPFLTGSFEVLAEITRDDP
jgi:hypothetical protein